MDDRQEMLQFFFEDLDEQIQNLERDILVLENNPSKEDIIQSMFRSMHNIKGNSGSMGFEKIKEVAHHAENLLDKIRNKILVVTKEMIDSLFICIDTFRSLETSALQNSKEDIDISPVLKRIKIVSEEAEKEQKKQDEKDIFSKELVDKIIQINSEGYSIYKFVLHLTCNDALKIARTQIIINRISKLSNIINTFADDKEENQSVTLILATQQDTNIIKNIITDEIDVRDVDVVEVDIDALKNKKSVTGKGKEPIVESDIKKGKTDSKSDEPKKQPIQKETIRVEVERLERLMNLIGEVIIDQTRVNQLSQLLRDSSKTEELLDEMDQVSVHMSKMISDLQENIMKTRMVPVEKLFSRYPRLVRDASQKLKKEVKLVIEGGETEIDKKVFEEIGDPLVHIIRNSVDHGLETAEKRSGLGKPEIGTLKISAFHRENHAIIVVEDDGAGIDPVKIKASAVKKSIITEAQANELSDDQAVNLIFAPGFSTAATVNDISGRGVGMDVVRSQVEKINGIIQIDTKVNEGTKITIKIPLTLAIIKGLLVRFDNRTFSLPTNNIVEVVRIPKEDVMIVNEKKVIKLRNKVIPLTWLHHHFRYNTPTNHKKHHIVVIIGLAEKMVGLVVDKIIGNQEIVVKSLGQYVGKITGISGATILGDGTVSLILDVAGVFEMISERVE